MSQDLQTWTDKNIEIATPGRHQIAGTKGLYLYVTPSGDVRRFIYRYTRPTNKRITETGLGIWPAVELTDAKAKADELRKLVASGVDPVASKRA